MLLSSQAIDPGSLPEGRPRPESGAPAELIDLPFSGGSERVLARYNPTDRSRGQELMRRALSLDPAEAEGLAAQVLADFGLRHRELEPLLLYHFHQVVHLLPKARAASLSQAQKLLIGAYFTREEAIEAGGLCCPSLVPAPGPLESDGALRVIFSFQAQGQDQCSSLVFREGRLEGDAIVPLPGSHRVALPGIEEFPDRPRGEIEPMIRSLPLSNGLRAQLLKQLPDPYVYADLFQLVDQYRLNCPQVAERKALQQLLAAVDDYYDLHFGPVTSLSERVIAPQLDHESRGLEDVRFVHFSDPHGRRGYYATYTANGQQSQQRLLQTDDFLQFRSYSLSVPSGSQLALFPRKVRGSYAMLCQVDRFHQCIFFSDRITRWQHPILLQEPRAAWELSALGNCGAPIETPQGWLVLTHGTGPMGVRALSACLLDRDDPTRILARLREPLSDSVPGLKSGSFSSSGSLLHRDRVLIPFTLDHRETRLLALPLGDLLARMEAERQYE